MFRLQVQYFIAHSSLELLTRQDMHRNEFKFFVNTYQKDVMTNKLVNICQRDSFSDADGGYLVSSLYFDDYNQSAFYDKVNGIRDRKKFRVRVYNYESDVIKFERKIKREYATEKSYLRISKEEYEALVNGDVNFLRQKNHVVAIFFNIVLFPNSCTVPLPNVT